MDLIFSAFKTEHSLEFEIAEWPVNLNDDTGHRAAPWFQFRVGTCEGLWRDNGDAYEILAIINSQPHNGHLVDVFQWFEYSCKRDKKNLKVLEILNTRFEQYLLRRGFEKIKLGVIKKFGGLK